MAKKNKPEQQTLPERAQQGASELSPRQKMVHRLRHDLARMAPELQKVLPEEISPQRFARICLTSVQKSPGLLEVDPMSLMAAMVELATVGVEPDTSLQLAHLVPFAGKAQIIWNYRGIIRLAMQSGAISYMEAHNVYSNDKFEHEYGTNGHVRFIPCEAVDQDARGRYRLSFAVVRYKDGTTQHHVSMPWEIEEARRTSKTSGRGDSPWNTNLDAMRRKTPIRRLQPFLPLTSHAQKALSFDNLAMPPRLKATFSEVQASQDSPALSLVGDASELQPPEDLDQLAEQIASELGDGDGA